ncbi:MAG: hypothetical protein PHW03_05895 [Eubacteriales bacterium]|nr:hypothetical protein [Eubacteriales bacterium]MDD4390319.1 hypothetical protein [Eubacteriales bacterium]
MGKATIEDLLARKMQKEENRAKTYEIPVVSMGGKVLTFKRPSDEMRLDLMDEMGSNPDMRKTIGMYKKIIYLSCEMLQDKELHEELGIKDPFDTVDAIFDLDDITDIGEKLMDAMESPVDEIKNS